MGQDGGPCVAICYICACLHVLYVCVCMCCMLHACLCLPLAMYACMPCLVCVCACACMPVCPCSACSACLHTPACYLPPPKAPGEEQNNDRYYVFWRNSIPFQFCLLPAAAIHTHHAIYTMPLCSLYVCMLFMCLHMLCLYMPCLTIFTPLPCLLPATACLRGRRAGGMGLAGGEGLCGRRGRSGRKREVGMPCLPPVGEEGGWGRMGVDVSHLGGEGEEEGRLGGGGGGEEEGGGRDSCLPSCLIYILYIYSYIYIYLLYYHNMYIYIYNITSSHTILLYYFPYALPLYIYICFSSLSPSCLSPASPNKTAAWHSNGGWKMEQIKALSHSCEMGTGRRFMLHPWLRQLRGRKGGTWGGGREEKRKKNLSSMLWAQHLISRGERGIIEARREGREA